MSSATERRISKLEDAELERLRCVCRHLVEQRKMDPDAPMPANLPWEVLRHFTHRGWLPPCPARWDKPAHLMTEADSRAFDAYVARMERVTRAWLWGRP